MDSPSQVSALSGSGPVPVWVPTAAIRYLAHTEAGLSIRALARAGGCHASTVLRQIRRLETLRDDVLVDEALCGIGRLAFGRHGSVVPEEAHDMTMQDNFESGTYPDAAELRREGRRVLRRLCDPGAVLAVAADMEKAVVVRDTPSGTTERLAVLDRAVAQAMALKDWIACAAPGRVSRYTITPSGRAELNRLMVQTDIAGGAVRRGMAEAPAGFVHIRDAIAGTGLTGLSGAIRDEAEDEDDEAPGRRRIRYGGPDSPVSMLARRRDKDGNPFLDEVLVRAGERLTEDFELAQMGPRTTQNWDRFLTSGTSGGAARGDPGLRGPEAARARVAAALHDLGFGLGDVALRCCCYQQGLETVERHMGWSARSGKIVLRIALQRLRRHYDAQGDAGGMIG